MEGLVSGGRKGIDGGSGLGSRSLPKLTVSVGSRGGGRTLKAAGGVTDTLEDPGFV